MADGDRQMIAANHDNIAGLKELRELDTVNGLFHIFRFPLKSTWHDGESIRGDSTSFPKDIGLPYVTWELGVVTEAEFKYLRDTFVKNVTIFEYCPVLLDWFDYNGRIFLPKPGVTTFQRQGTWTPFPIDIRDLEDITP